jgi:hypothetical protein
MQSEHHPLYFTSSRLSSESAARECVINYINTWGQPQGWRADVVITKTHGKSFLTAQVVIMGPPPFPSLDDLTGDEIAEACPTIDFIEVGFFPARYIEL